MKRATLALVLLLFAVVPAATAAKGMNGPVRVSWNGVPPADTPVGGTWDARFSLVQDPGGFYAAKQQHPVLVVTDRATGAMRRIPAIVDISPNTFRASVPFPRAGAYEVVAANIDPRRPKSVDRWGPVRIGPAVGASGDGSASWPWILAALGTLSALGGGSLALLRARGRADARLRGAGPPAPER